MYIFTKKVLNSVNTGTQVLHFTLPKIKHSGYLLLITHYLDGKYNSIRVVQNIYMIIIITTINYKNQMKLSRSNIWIIIGHSASLCLMISQEDDPKQVKYNLVPYFATGNETLFIINK